jgi:hypothetical protein
MGSFQFVVIDRDDRLAMVDCIIGAVLARKGMDRRFEEGFDPNEMGISQADFEKLSRLEQNEVVEG